MAVKKIPARTEITCDICSKPCNQRKLDCTLLVKKNGLDLVGDPTGPGDEQFDLCDPCVHIVMEHLRLIIPNQLKNSSYEDHDPFAERF